MYPPFQATFQLGPLTLHWYGVIMTLAIFLGSLVASRYVGRRGQDPTTLWDMLLWILIPAIVGARLYYVFIQAPRTNAPGGVGDYLAHPEKILAIWQGGIHIYGALIFGAIALILYARWRKLPLPIYLDGIGLGLLLGQCIGRLGNFMNQELYGPPTTLPWGLRIDQGARVPQYSDMTRYPDSTRFQPLFLYEMTWDGLGFLLIFWISRRFEKRLLPGDLALLYLIWAPLGRFFTEFFRTDSWFFPGTPFDVVHLLTASAVVVSAVILVVRHRRHPATQVEPESAVSEEPETVSNEQDNETDHGTEAVSTSDAPQATTQDTLEARAQEESAPTDVADTLGAGSVERDR